MNRISKQFAVGSVAAFLLALSGAGVAGAKGSAELQREIISGDQPVAGTQVTEPVRADRAEGSAADKGEDKTEHMLKQQADELSGDNPVAGPEVKQPALNEKAEASAADKAEDKTEKVLKDSSEAVYSPHD